MTTFSDAEISKAFQETPALSELSKLNYISRIRTLGNLFDTTIEEIISKPEYYIARLKRIYQNEKTQKGYFSLVTAIFRYIPEFKEKHPDDYLAWSKALGIAHDKVETEVENNRASERQLAGYVPFKEIEAKRDSLPKGSPDRTLLSIYSLIPPSRADFNRVKLYHGKFPTSGNLEPNYIHITSRGMKLVLNEYKTNKKYGRLEQELPPALVKEIQENLRIFPREWLFTDRTGAPYSANAFTKWVSRRFRELFDKPLTITLIRHAYINALDTDNMTIAERNEIGRKMGHDWVQQSRYKLIFRDAEGKVVDKPVEKE